TSKKDNISKVSNKKKVVLTTNSNLASTTNSNSTLTMISNSEPSVMTNPETNYCEKAGPSVKNNNAK
ncbi:4349_t:CDS:2, partial [Dentiscutata erythropus]